MIHQKSDIAGQITVVFEAEDWVWLCDLLSRILDEPGHDKYSREDTEHLLDVLRSAELGQ